MKIHDSAGKRTPPETGPTSRPGSRALRLAPPAYGIDFLDRETRPAEGQQLLQRKSIPSTANRENQARSLSQTGLPDNLKTGIEALSGLSLDDVQVHYNSSKPGGLQALAYTQGSDIHLAPGQERHLPHEAWHVVQQKQGRVKPTMQRQGAAINDDPQLEQEADRLGARSLAARPSFFQAREARNERNGSEKAAVQRKVKVRSHTIDSLNYASRFKPGIARSLDEIADKKSWSEEFKSKVLAKIEELINSATTYPTSGSYTNYKYLIGLVAREISTAAPLPLKPVGSKLPALSPEPILSGAMDIDREEDSFLSRIVHDESSQYREYFQESDQIETIPDEFRIAAERRQQQKIGVLDPSKIPTVGIGKHSGELRGHGSVLTPLGGGKGETYKELSKSISGAVTMFGSTEPELAQAILDMLHGDATALFKYSNFVLYNVDHLLAIIAGPESSRATSAVIHFAATIYAISQKLSSFENAFSGPGAIFLGANEGGAEALRLAPSEKLKGQADRAEQALQQYLSNYGKDVDVSTISFYLQTNIASYSRKRQT